MKKPKKKPTPRTKKNPIRSRDIPATAGMIYDLRDELIERFDRLDSRIDGVHCELDKKIDGVHCELDNKVDGGLSRLEKKIDGDICKLDKKMEGLHCKLDKKIDAVESGLRADNHQLRILIEEQNARNIFTIDQLNSLFHRQDRIEKKLDEAF